MTDPKRGASGSEKRQRPHIVAVRLNGPERAELAARADRVGLSMPAYIRHQALDAAPPRQRPRPTVEVAMLARLLGQVGQMGGAVNEMADTVRASRYLPGPEARTLDALRAELKLWGAELLRAMGRDEGRDSGAGDDH